jgi:uncharacterized protein
VVLDTNVLVSGLLRADGPPGRVVDLVTAGRLTVLYDDRIVGEYDEVLHRPRFDFEPRAVHAILTQIRADGEHVSAEPLAVVLPDPDDLPFFEVAVAGAARALITGNAPHYKPTKGAHHVPIRSPRDFIAEWSRK